MWPRQLRRSAIRPDENFFDLGGASLLARAVGLEIAAATGRELPITTIYDAPTIDALAALLEDERTPQYCPLVLLKPGADMAPLFIVHGLGGNVVEILPLANRIETPRPIYGIQARGVDGIELPLQRVEDMAEAYLDAIRTVQPNGPYFLAGYSFGGLVAFEMAH